MTFALAAQPPAGTGMVKLFVPSAIADFQMAGNQNLGQLNNQPFNAGLGGYVTFVTCNSSGAATDPANGEGISFAMYLNNSQVQ